MCKYHLCAIGAIGEDGRQSLYTSIGEHLSFTKKSGMESGKLQLQFVAEVCSDKSEMYPAALVADAQKSILPLMK